MFLDWLERRIDPFAPFDETRMPPKSVTGFAWFYLRPIRGALAALFAIAVIAGTVEASLYLVMRWFIDVLAVPTGRRCSPNTPSASASPSR